MTRLRFPASRRKAPPAAFAVALLLLAAPAAARQKAVLAPTEVRLRELEQQIELDRVRLARAADAERGAAETLLRIEREVALRAELARLYARRIKQLSFQADSVRAGLASLETNARALKDEYAVHAIQAYRYGRLNDLALVLSAGSVNQMLVRARYLSRFAAQRRRKLEALGGAAGALQARRDTILAAQRRTEELLTQTAVQERSLSRLRGERQRLIVEARKERASLQQTLGRKQEAAADLQAMVRRLGAAAPARPRPAARAPARPAAPRAASGSFAGARGRVPWPVSGVVREPFGERVNALYGTTTTNPGLIIASNPAEDVRAVFEGTVVLVDVMPEYGVIVAVAHGPYKTIYGNLSATAVKEGDFVASGSALGKAGRDEEPQGAALFFALFREGEPIDPLPWLTPR